MEMEQIKSSVGVQMNVNLVLVVVLIVLAIMAVRGARKGLVSELMSVLSIFAAVIILALVATAIGSALDDQFVKVLVAVIFIVVCSLIMKLASIILNAIELIVRLPIISGANRLGGMVLGLIEGLLCIWVAMVMFQWFDLWGLADYVTKGIEANTFLQFLSDKNLVVYILAQQLTV